MRNPPSLLEPAEGLDLIVAHADDIPLNRQVSKDDYLYYCTKIILTLVKADEEFKALRVYGHL